MKRKIIEFAKPEEWYPPLSLSKPPEWYNKEKFTNISDMKSLPDEKNIRQCIPVMDSYYSGYTIETPCDLAVRIENTKPVITWSTASINPVKIRSHEIAGGLPIPHGHNDSHFVWNFDMVLKTPAGYSLLITHPLNRYDLPFTTLSGIVDADIMLHQGTLPFFIKEGFEGFIPKGTPYAQVLPFKRESWKSQENQDLYEKGKILTMNCSVSKGFYRKNIWHKKDYK
jgi:hypothetical protein